MLNFDTNYKKIIDRMVELAEREFPKRNWYLEITCWDDTDFIIRLVSSWRRTKDIFQFKNQLIMR